MTTSNGAARSAARPATFKQEVVASRAIVATNHPLASTAGIEALTMGGNAVDAAVASLFALSVVEPMMVSPFGAGFFTIRDGRSGDVVFVDDYATVPGSARADMYRPIPGSMEYETADLENDVGYRAVATPGALRSWAHVVARYGRLSLADVLGPAIRYAERGFTVGGYLAFCIQQSEAALRRFPASAEVFLPGGRVPAVGSRIVRKDFGRTLRQIAEDGPEAMYTGSLAKAIVADMERNGGLISLEDLAEYRVVERSPVRGTYRGHEIVAPAPPSSGGTHIVQMLGILEGFPIGRGDLAYGTPGYIHLLAEAYKIAFADRRRYMADPDRVHVPVDFLTSPGYLARRRSEIDPSHARNHAAGEAPALASFLGSEHHSTTHLTVMDDEGTIVAATQTLNSLFGSKVTTPGTGMLLNNHMVLMDPVPGRANSIEPGKRVLSSMSPSIVLKNGQPFMALGTPGAKRIFGAVAQGMLNVIDHGMTLQEAFEAPRVWTQGADLEIEDTFPNAAELKQALERMGHRVVLSEKIAGGMNGVLLDERGMLHGAACWRADGVPIGISGGPARLVASAGVPI
ncbi:MAG: gamma-glutamyltransferase [Chloroflexota bacterium]